MVTLAFGRTSSSLARAALPPLTPSRARAPNVLVLLTESVRASDFGEETAPDIHAVLGAGVRFSEMRAVASYTALSLSALLTGLPQTGSREDVLLAPDLFDFAHAMGGAHYWSAHSETVFERKDVGRSLTSFVTADTLLGHPIGDVEEAVAGGLDRRLAAECQRRMPGLESPYLVMAHFSGTHAPYFFDESRARFAPFSHAATWSGLDALHHAYQNAIAEQDRSLAACARAFLDSQKDTPWIIVLTSDHGEAFGEHAAIHHGQNLYDEQVHVPAILAAGNGALTGAEARALKENAAAFATHLDLVPTLLDALGVRDHFALARHVARMPGRSLLRAASPSGPLPITNCSEMFPCPLSAWGVLAPGRKLFAQPWDRGWKCLRSSGGEHEVPLAECVDLVDLSHGVFPVLPNGEPNR
jgi:glucan phosphoethanolaminetransferase (alkaline phosphatase superfamily)